MKRVLHLDQSQGMISVDTHLRVGKNILVSFIALFTAILARIKKIWIVAKIRRVIGSYDQRVFWVGSVICCGLAVLTIMVIAEDHWKPHDLDSLLFKICFIFYLFYGLLLPITKKDANGQTNWL